MKVIRGQEARLESSKGFYRGSRSLIHVLSTHDPKFMKIYQNEWESTKSFELFEKLKKSLKLREDSGENLWKSV